MHINSSLIINLSVVVSLYLCLSVCVLPHDLTNCKLLQHFKDILRKLMQQLPRNTEKPFVVKLLYHQEIMDNCVNQTYSHHILSHALCMLFLYSSLALLSVTRMRKCMCLSLTVFLLALLLSINSM